MSRAQRSLRRPGAALALCLCAGMPLAALDLVAAGSAEAARPAAAASVKQDGPHAPAGRVPAPTTVTRQGNVAVSRYDLGDVEIGSRPGQYRAPMRGSLVTPTTGADRSKLVIVSHLRSAGCANDVFAFPCPGGKEVRLDRGMEYLGKALAAKGYTVLIPDVAPVWIGSTLTAPYDQTAAWLKVVGGTRAALSDDVNGGTHHFGLPLKDRVDLSGAGLVVHSRSGFIAGPAANAWRSTSMPLTSVLAYGPAYDVPDANNHVTAPVPGDLPYLGLVGDKDQDVPFNADLWLAQNIEQKRSAPALVATVPGLGHDYVNQTLSASHTDDRLDCSGSSCPSAAVHERFLTTAAEQFFDATMRHAPTQLPVRPTDVLPTSVAGLPARWLAVTNAADRVTLFDADSSKAPTVSKGSSATICRFYDPQDPTHYADACPDPGLGTPMLVSKVARVQLAKAGTVTLPTRASGVHQVDVQVANYADRADHGTDSPLKVTLRTSDGRRVALTMPADASEVTKNRATADENGTYVLGTLRIPVPATLRGTTITAVEVTAPRGGTYALRAVDVLGRAVSGAPTSPTSSTTAMTPPATGHPAGVTPTVTHPITGPVVQTDREAGPSRFSVALVLSGLTIVGGLLAARARLRH